MLPKICTSLWTPMPANWRVPSNMQKSAWYLRTLGSTSTCTIEFTLKRVANREVGRFTEAADVLHLRPRTHHHLALITGPLFARQSLHLSRKLIHLIRRSEFLCGRCDEQTQLQQLLRALGDELDELHLAPIPAEFMDDHLGDVRLQALDRMELSPKLGIVPSSGLIDYEGLQRS